MTTLNTEIETFTFDSGKEGPNLLIFGAIHGDEFCGALALQKLIKQIEAGEVPLEKGSVTLVPVCNPEAYAAGKRQIEENLNRVFKKHANPQSYEAHLANTLTALVDECDYLLDLHSQGSDGKPFVFLDYETEKSEQMAVASGVGTIFTGWPEMYGDNSPLNAGDTLGYVFANGKEGILVECGQHLDPKAPDTAYQVAMNVMAHLGIQNTYQPEKSEVTAKYHAKTLYAVPDCGGSLTQHWGHLQDVSKGTVLAVSGDGEDIKAPYDGVVILPKYKAEAGQEWFYLGQKKSLGM